MHKLSDSPSLGRKVTWLQTKNSGEREVEGGLGNISWRKYLLRILLWWTYVMAKKHPQKYEITFHINLTLLIRTTVEQPNEKLCSTHWAIESTGIGSVHYSIYVHEIFSRPLNACLGGHAVLRMYYRTIFRNMKHTFHINLTPLRTRKNFAPSSGIWTYIFGLPDLGFGNWIQGGGADVLRMASRKEGGGGCAEECVSKLQ